MSEQIEKTDIEQLVFFSRLVGRSEANGDDEDAAHFQKKVNIYSGRLEAALRNTEEKTNASA